MVNLTVLAEKCRESIFSTDILLAIFLQDTELTVLFVFKVIAHKIFSSFTWSQLSVSLPVFRAEGFLEW